MKLQFHVFETTISPFELKAEGSEKCLIQVLFNLQASGYRWHNLTYSIPAVEEFNS